MARLTGRQMLKNVQKRMAGRSRSASVPSKKRASKSSAMQDLTDVFTQPQRGAIADGMRKRVLQGRDLGQKATLNEEGNLNFSPRARVPMASTDRNKDIAFKKKSKKSKVKRSKKMAKSIAAREGHGNQIGKRYAHKGHMHRSAKAKKNC